MFVCCVSDRENQSMLITYVYDRDVKICHYIGIFIYTLSSQVKVQDLRLEMLRSALTTNIMLYLLSSVLLGRVALVRGGAGYSHQTFP